MKKIISIFVLALLILALASCSDTTTERLTNTEITTETPSMMNEYDERGLVSDSCQSLENIEDWQPVWCDEFDVDGLPNNDNWTYDVGGHGWGNSELQYYTSGDLDNAYVEDGILNIQAIKEDYDGNDYTSARLVTKYNGDWLYGRVQVRAKMPSGRGLWPAVWMLPTSRTYGGWPDSGEIDIMEYVGYNPGVVHGTIHTGAYNHMLGTQLGYTESVTTVEDAFHVYEMIWEPGAIELFIDGERFAVFGYNPNLNVDIENSDAWPFDHPFHLILNVAIGGTWGGSRGVDDSIFPQKMEIDYVRVYQKDYEGMDQENPTQPTDIVIQDITHDTVRLKWDNGEDDVMISHYNIYVDDILTETTTLNAIRIKDLDYNTSYNISVQSEDFAENKSDLISVSATTDDITQGLGIIQAEDYDEASGVSKQQSDDIDGTLNVSSIHDGDYMIYILNIEETGTYRISFRIASETEGGTIQLFTRVRPDFTLIFEATGGWQVWDTVASDTFTITAGVYSFKISALEGGFNLNYFEIERIE